MTNESTKPVAANLSYEQYCAAVGADAQAAREATVPRALLALMGGKLKAPRVPSFEVSK